MMVTIAWLGLSTVNPLGSDDESIRRSKVSLSSRILSSIIGAPNGTLVTPAGNMTVYGPKP